MSVTVTPDQHRLQLESIWRDLVQDTVKTIQTPDTETFQALIQELIQFPSIHSPLTKPIKDLLDIELKYCQPEQFPSFEQFVIEQTKQAGVWLRTQDASQYIEEKQKETERSTTKQNSLRKRLESYVPTQAPLEDITQHLITALRQQDDFITSLKREGFTFLKASVDLRFSLTDILYDPFDFYRLEPTPTLSQEFIQSALMEWILNELSLQYQFSPLQPIDYDAKLRLAAQAPRIVSLLDAIGSQKVNSLSLELLLELLEKPLPYAFSRISSSKTDDLGIATIKKYFEEIIALDSKLRSLVIQRAIFISYLFKKGYTLEDILNLPSFQRNFLLTHIAAGKPCHPYSSIPKKREDTSLTIWLKEAKRSDEEVHKSKKMARKVLSTRIVVGPRCSTSRR